jgi:Fe-S-cluster containining protein
MTLADPAASAGDTGPAFEPALDCEASYRETFDCQTFDCQACGACCSYSAEWPRFSLEDDVALERIPPGFVDDEGGRMRCDGDRCAALVGEVGKTTACAVYAVRPDVCRACLPGDDECRKARSRFNL